MIDAIAEARLEVGRRKQALRDYRALHLQKLKPKGGRPPKVRGAVAEALSATVRKSPAMIAREISGSRQAVRKALMRLVQLGKAKRLGKPGQWSYYIAIPEVQNGLVGVSSAAVKGRGGQPNGSSAQPRAGLRHHRRPDQDAV